MSILPAPSRPTYRISFVCTGNICRSPIAEVVLRALVEEAGLTGAVEIDSAGTGAWHVGNRADPRALAALERSGYDGSAHRAQVVTADWVAERDLVIALDRGHLRALAGEARERVVLLRSFDDQAPAGAEVADPYYGSDDDFRETLHQVERACRGLVDELARVLPGERV